MEGAYSCDAQPPGSIYCIYQEMFKRGRLSRANAVAGRRPASGCRHRDADGLGIDGGVMRYVIFVAEEKLQRMASERQGNLRLSLSRSKMQVIKIIGNRLAQRRKRGVHEEMVMASIGFFDPGRCYAH